MIHVVTEANRALYAAEFEALHVLAGDDPRRRAAIAGTARSVHLLRLDGEGEPEFACRLSPTDGPCLLDELPVAALLAGLGVARGPGAWERAPIYAAPAICGPEPGQRRKAGELRLAVLEEAGERGAARVVELAACNALGEVLRCGWRLRMLGLPVRFEGVARIAIEVDSTPEAAAELRERLGAGASRRLHLKPGDADWAARPKEVESFLAAAQQLHPAKLEPLLVALRAAVAEDEET